MNDREEGLKQPAGAHLFALDLSGLVATIREAVKEEIRGQIQALRPTLEEKPPTPSQAPEYLTREETAQLLKVSSATLATWKRKSILTPCKIGGRTLYKRSEVDKATKTLRGGRTKASKRITKEE